MRCDAGVLLFTYSVLASGLRSPTYETDTPTPARRFTCLSHLRGA